jgi:hypothetical protein
VEQVQLHVPVVLQDIMLKQQAVVCVLNVQLELILLVKQQLVHSVLKVLTNQPQVGTHALNAQVVLILLVWEVLYVLFVLLDLILQMVLQHVLIVLLVLIVVPIVILVQHVQKERIVLVIVLLALVVQQVNINQPQVEQYVSNVHLDMCLVL